MQVAGFGPPAVVRHIHTHHQHQHDRNMGSGFATTIAHECTRILPELDSHGCCLSPCAHVQQTTGHRSSPAPTHLGAHRSEHLSRDLIKHAVRYLQQDARQRALDLICLHRRTPHARRLRLFLVVVVAGSTGHRHGHAPPPTRCRAHAALWSEWCSARAQASAGRVGTQECMHARTGIGGAPWDTLPHAHVLKHAMSACAHTSEHSAGAHYCFGKGGADCTPGASVSSEILVSAKALLTSCSHTPSCPSVGLRCVGACQHSRGKLQAV